MVKVVSLLMAMLCTCASDPATLEEKPDQDILHGSSVVTEVKPQKKPPFIDGVYDIYGETDGYVQPRFEEKEDGTTGGAGQNDDGTTGGAGQKVDVDALFENKKKELDQKYKKMFELSEREDELSDELRKINEEYWKMKESYDREFKKLLREWSKTYDLFIE